MEIILCRHGETEWTLSKQHTGNTNLPLTKNGEMQAKALAPKLKNYVLEKVYASPLQRAYDTAILAGMSHPILEPLAVEWNYGTYEGLTTEEIHKKNPAWNLFKDGTPNGDNAESIGKRADLLIEKLLQENKTVALFSHGHFLRVFAARWIGLSPIEGRCFTLSVSSVSVLGFERSQRVISIWNHT